MSWWLWLLLIVVVLFGFVVFRGAPYVPTKRRLLEQAFDTLYPLNKNDLLVDIGCGDGIVLRAAAARGARAVGYELNPVLYGIARFLSSSPLIRVYLADFWRVCLPAETTVVYTFGESRDIAKMYDFVEKAASQYGRTIYFISFGFAVPGKKEVKYDGSFYLYKISAFTD